MGLIAMLPNYNPACRKSFTIVETVKEASAVCRSFLDEVVIFISDRSFRGARAPKNGQEFNFKNGKSFLIKCP